MESLLIFFLIFSYFKTNIKIVQTCLKMYAPTPTGIGLEFTVCILKSKVMTFVILESIIKYKIFFQVQLDLKKKKFSTKHKFNI